MHLFSSLSGAAASAHCPAQSTNVRMTTNAEAEAKCRRGRTDCANGWCAACTVSVQVESWNFNRFFSLL